MIGDIILEMIKINEHDTRRINHALKVYGLAKCIAQSENVSCEDMIVVEAAAVLHDIGIKHCENVFGCCSGKMQEEHGPGIANEILEKFQISQNLRQRVLYLIAHHHTYHNIKGIDYQILIEADFLVNYDEGDFGKDAFLAAYNKYFKTGSAKRIAKNMFML